MDRILRNVASTITVTIYQDGIPADASPDAATVTITRSDGTVLVSSATAIDDGTGVYAYTLTPTQTAQLDTLTADWTVTVGGVASTVTTTIEVAGGFLFTIADARATSGLNATNNDGSYKISNAEIVAMRTTVEQALEDACGVAFVPRYRTQILDGSGSYTQLLDRPRVTAIRSVTVGGSVWDASGITALSTGLISSSQRFTYGHGNVVVGYEHGYSLAETPARVKRAALALAKRWLAGSPADDRATTMVTDEQTTSFYVPRSSEMFDVPEANIVVRQYGYVIGVA